MSIEDREWLYFTVRQFKHRVASQQKKEEIDRQAYRQKKDREFFKHWLVTNKYFFYNNNDDVEYCYSSKLRHAMTFLFFFLLADEDDV